MELPCFDVDENGEVVLDDILGSGVETAVEELPFFVDSLRVSDISKEIEKALVLALDLPSVTGQRLRNWQDLADALGMPWQEIHYLEQRAKHPSSPTSQLLLYFRDTNLGRVLRLIRDDMGRVDVIRTLKPHLFNLEVRSQAATSESVMNSMTASGSNRASNSCCSSSVTDSRLPSFTAGSQSTLGPSASGAFNSTSGNSSRYLHEDIVQLSLAYVKDVSKHENFRRPQYSADSLSCISGMTFPALCDKLILVTFCTGDDTHLRNVKWLCKNLKSLNAQIVTDDPAKMGAHSMTDCLEAYFHKAKSIVVVASPSYGRLVASNSSDFAPISDQHSMNTLYLYKLMLAEYHECGARNRRFRPVTFSPEHFSDVPSFLKTTIVYNWPSQHDKLMELISSDLAV